MVAAAAAVVRWWWPQWLMDNGPSREGCLRSLARVKTHAERTKSEEKGEQATEGKGVQKKTEEGEHRGTVRLSKGTAEEVEKDELSSAVEFLRRATQGEAEVNPHQRSSRQLKIPALAIFMTVSSTGETTTVA